MHQQAVDIHVTKLVLEPATKLCFGAALGTGTAAECVSVHSLDPEVRCCAVVEVVLSGSVQILSICPQGIHRIALLYGSIHQCDGNTEVTTVHQSWPLLYRNTCHLILAP